MVVSMLLKRIFDIIISTLGIIILSPLFIVIAMLIKLTSKGSVFFKQQRVGLNQQIFKIHKFRTMEFGSNSSGLKITIGKDKRVTPVGMLLRKLKLDELPQLIDVFIGNMSLVGPRPEVPEYVKYYPLEAKTIVFSVRPGITDWASLKMIDENKILAGKQNPEAFYINELIPIKLAYAIKYVKSRNFLQDLAILLATVVKIIIR